MFDGYQLSPVNFSSESSALPSPEEGRSVQRPKCYDKYDDKDEDNSPKNVNNAKHISFTEFFLHKSKVCIVWKWFIAKIILISQECLF